MGRPTAASRPAIRRGLVVTLEVPLLLNVRPGIGFGRGRLIGALCGLQARHTLSCHSITSFRISGPEVPAVESREPPPGGAAMWRRWRPDGVGKAAGRLRLSPRSPSAVGAAGPGIEAVNGRTPGRHHCRRGRAPGCRPVNASDKPPRSDQTAGRSLAPSARCRLWDRGRVLPGLCWRRSRTGAAKHRPALPATLSDFGARAIEINHPPDCGARELPPAAPTGRSGRAAWLARHRQVAAPGRAPLPSAGARSRRTNFRPTTERLHIRVTMWNDAQ
jgi:hypothetical protein